MKSTNRLFQPKAVSFGLLILLVAGLIGVLIGGFPAALIDGNTAQRLEPEAPAISTIEAAVPSPLLQGSPVEVVSAPNSDGISNGGHFTDQTRRLQDWLDEGNPVEVQIGEGAPARYGFREFKVTSDDFRLSSGVNSELPAEYRVYSGREMLDDGTLGEPVSLAVVNGAVAMAITQDGENFLVETDPRTGELYAIPLASNQESHSCNGADCASGHVNCAISPDGGLATMSAPAGVGEEDPIITAVTMNYPANARVKPINSEEPLVEAATVSHSYYRLGQEYNASLRDILVLFVSSKSQTGDSTMLSTRAASYLTVAARTADSYERQLGLRYLLQELILIPSDSSDADPGNPPSGVYSIQPDLEHFRTWLNSNRPQSTYKYGHAALWSLVDGGSGGVVGVAWTDSYGSSSYGHSVQERNWGAEVHTHELGHNIGSSHTSGGIMNPSLITGNEDFFKIVSNTSYTGAKDIYNYMGSASRAYVFGEATLRHPEEIPFGIDDAVSTTAGTTVTFSPLNNDLKQVTNGAVNTLRLVEVGQVFPLAAGAARVVDNQIEFIPAAGFTGQAWFSYTLAGNVGNSGSGWLHSADVIVTVGGNSTAPSQNPAMTLVDDYIVSDFSQQIKINPLLNDEGAGRLWSGNVEVMVGPNDSTPESYSDKAFRLVSASILSGNGTLVLDKRSMTRNGNAAQDNTGFLTYIPAANEANEVVIQYTVSDANGNTDTALISIARSTSIGVVSSTPSVAEDSGEVVAFTFERTGNVNLSIDEEIEFTVGGTADPSGLRADYAFAGHASFDPVSGFGTMVIPAGARQSHLYAAILDDGISEDYETCTITITGSSSALEIGQVNGQSNLYIRDTSVIYVEPFDSFNTDPASWNGWTNLKNMNASGKGGEDWFDWVVDSGTTPTTGTGPSADHTSGTGNYMLAEASGNVGDYAYFISPAIDVSGRAGAQLEFLYHMLGTGMGSLSLDVYVNGSLASSSIWSRSGAQSTNGTDWRNALVDLSPYLPANTIQLRFRADIGTTELSDIAIDDVRVMAVSAASPAAPTVLVDPVGCQVDEGQAVYLSVIPEAFPAPQIQWFKDGALISGATGPSYYIPSMDDASTGAYYALISNSEGSAVSLEAALDLPPPPPPPPPPPGYGLWTAQQGLVDLDPDHTDWPLPASDPDFDGIINLFEFAFGSLPLTSDTSRLPVMGVSESGGQVYLEITYTRRINGTMDANLDYLVDGLTYRVETATTLNGTWDYGVGVVEEVLPATPNPDGITETITVRRLSPLTGGPAFMRVSVVGAF